MIRVPTPLLGGVILAVAACGPEAQQARGPAPQARAPILTVEVQNQNHNAATVYAYREGFRDRLGYVEAANTETFEFRWPTYEVRFLIDFLAQGCVLSDRLPVDPGDELLLIIRVIDDDGASQQRCQCPRDPASCRQ